MTAIGSLGIRGSGDLAAFPVLIPAPMSLIVPAVDAALGGLSPVLLLGVAGPPLTVERHDGTDWVPVAFPERVTGSLRMTRSATTTGASLLCALGGNVTPPAEAPDGELTFDMAPGEERLFWQMAGQGHTLILDAPAGVRVEVRAADDMGTLMQHLDGFKSNTAFYVRVVNESGEALSGVTVTVYAMGAILG